MIQQAEDSGYPVIEQPNEGYQKILDALDKYQPDAAPSAEKFVPLTDGKALCGDVID